MRSYKHGGTRLRYCWRSMKRRSRQRIAKGIPCNVCVEWLDYTVFEVWATANGYNDSLIMCREGDVGDYKPSNVRWDTKASNLIEAKAKSYKFMYEGQLVEVYNLRQFCKERELSAGNMCSVHKQTKGYKTCKGYSKYIEG
jgi:hypothetical protein